MARPALPIALLLVAPSLAVAQTSVPAPAMPTADERITALERQLQSVQAEAQRARANAEQVPALRARVKALEEKNTRLVEIGQQLVAAYERKYRSGPKDPFQLGRRKLEAELQDKLSEIYSHRADAVASATP